MPLVKIMALRNSLKTIADLSDLSNLQELVVDKRMGQRSAAKKNRRNRHYENQFIRNSLTHHLQTEAADTADTGDTEETSGVADTGPGQS
jgi:hypothetical protein